MAERAQDDELEGWGVRWKPALWLVLGFFIALGAAAAGAYLFYRSAGAPHVNVAHEALFPSPRLNTRLDRSPDWTYAPPAEAARDPQVEVAMRALAKRGDGGYAPLEAAR